MTVLALIAGGIVIWNVYKKHLIKSTVKNTVSEKTDRLYVIETGKLEVDEVAGNLQVTDLKLHPDSTIFTEMASINKAPGLLVHLEIPSITVTGVKTPKALLNKEIEGRRVLIHRPSIELVFTEEGKDSLEKVEPVALYKQVLGDLSLMKFDTVSIVNATLTTRKFKSGEHNIRCDSVSIDLYRVAVDSLSDKDSSRILFAETVHFHCRKMKIRSGNKLYNYEVREIDLHSGKKTASIQQFKVDPTLGEAAFLKQFRYQVDRFDIVFNKIKLVNLQAVSLLQERIKADSLVVGSTKFNIYRDLSYPHDGKNRVGAFPHQQLMKLPLQVNIRKALFTNAYIEYRERNPKSEKSGRVRFHDVRVRIDNLTNQTAVLRSQPLCKLWFDARFLDKAPVHAIINFYPADPKGKFTINGTLGGMPAEGVNELAEPMGLATIESGTIREVNFSFQGSDYRADGPVNLLYDDLKIGLLKKDSTDRSLDKKKLASFLANIKVKNANPGKDKTIRQATVHFDRDTNRSFFHLVWKSIFTGVKEIVGIPR